jgi:hypothetical protein
VSLFSGFKSFFEKVGSVLEKFFGSSSTEQKIQGALTVVGAAIVTITSLAAGPAASAAVSGIIKMVQTDYATFCAVVQQGTPVPGSTAATAATTALNSLKANLTALLSDAGVKNSANATKIADEVTTIVNELEAIEAAIVPAPVAPAAPVAS